MDELDLALVNSERGSCEPGGAPRQREKEDVLLCFIHVRADAKCTVPLRTQDSEWFQSSSPRISIGPAGSRRVPLRSGFESPDLDRRELDSSPKNCP